MKAWEVSIVKWLCDAQRRQGGGDFSNGFSGRMAVYTEELA